MKMILTSNAKDWLKSVQDHSGETILRDSDKEMMVFDKPSNDRELLKLRGIYNKQTKQGKVFAEGEK